MQQVVGGIGVSQAPLNDRHSNVYNWQITPETFRNGLKLLATAANGKRGL